MNILYILYLFVTKTYEIIRQKFCKSKIKNQEENYEKLMIDSGIEITDLNNLTNNVKDKNNNDVFVIYNNPLFNQIDQNNIVKDIYNQ